MSLIKKKTISGFKNITRELRMLVTFTEFTRRSTGSTPGLGVDNFKSSLVATANEMCTEENTSDPEISKCSISRIQ